MARAQFLPRATTLTDYSDISSAAFSTTDPGVPAAPRYPPASPHRFYAPPASPLPSLWSPQPRSSINPLYDTLPAGNEVLPQVSYYRAPLPRPSALNQLYHGMGGQNYLRPASNLGPLAAYTRCPYCNQMQQTRVQRQSNFMNTFMACMCYPCSLCGLYEPDNSERIIHYCSSCGRKIGP